MSPQHLRSSKALMPDELILGHFQEILDRNGVIGLVRDDFDEALGLHANLFKIGDGLIPIISRASEEFEMRVLRKILLPRIAVTCRSKNIFAAPQSTARSVYHS